MIIARGFSVFLLVFILGCVSTPKAGESAAQVAKLDSARTYAIMQGVTGPNWTRLNLLRQKNEKLEIRFLAADGQEIDKKNLRLSTHEYTASDWVIDEFHLQALNPAETLKMRVEKDGELRDERSFRLRPVGQKVKFAVVSCSDDFYINEQKKMWQHVAEQRPQFIFAIGDNTYADSKDGQGTGDSSPEVLWRRYVETRQSLDLFRQRELIPIIAIWDDHDYGQNDGDRRFANKTQSLQIFKSFFPQSSDRDGFIQGPGAASRFHFGEQQFLFLDARSFRSPNKPVAICTAKPEFKLCQPRPQSPRPADKWARKEPETHFGHAQTEWSLSQIRGAGSDVTWMISGDQWFGAYSPFESFEGNHPADFKKLMERMKDEKSSRIAFISGDRHSSEFLEVENEVLGYKTFEVVSSPIHARVFPSNWIDFPNPRQKAGVASAYNYTIIESEVRDHLWTIKTKNYKMDAAGKGQIETGFENQTLIERPVAD